MLYINFAYNTLLMLCHFRRLFFPALLDDFSFPPMTLTSEMGRGFPLLIILLLVLLFYFSYFWNWNLFIFQMPLPIFLASDKLISAITVV